MQQEEEVKMSSEWYLHLIDLYYHPSSQPLQYMRFQIFFGPSFILH
jgi:hypothetical protein